MNSFRQEANRFSVRAKLCRHADLQSRKEDNREGRRGHLFKGDALLAAVNCRLKRVKMS